MADLIAPKTGMNLSSRQTYISPFLCKFAL